jgi:hypothetical protein
MKLHPFRQIALVLLLATGVTARLSAQGPVGLRITSLTSAERDSISRHMADTGGPMVVYACVPAGIMVFGSPQRGLSAAELRAQAVGSLQPLVGEDRIGQSIITLQAAEEACENARHQ